MNNELYVRCGIKLLTCPLRYTFTRKIDFQFFRNFGKLTIAFIAVASVKGGNVILSVDGKQVTQKRLDATIGIRFSLDETWDVGQDTGTPIDYATYDVPFKFNGELKKLSVDLKESHLTAADEKKIKEGEKSLQRVNSNPVNQ